MADLVDKRMQRSDRLPLLSFLGRSSSDQSSGPDGLLSAVIAGSLILVLALMGLTIAIGRAPVKAAADQTDPIVQATSASPTSYASPEPTGPRYTAEPIILGVPQKTASYEAVPSASAAPSENAPEPEETDERPSGPSGWNEQIIVGTAESAASDRLQELQRRLEEGLLDNLPQGWPRNEG